MQIPDVLRIHPQPGAAPALTVDKSGPVIPARYVREAGIVVPG
jgi:hypothetical protein